MISRISNIRLVNILIVPLIVLSISGFNMTTQELETDKDFTRLDQYDLLDASSGWVLSDKQLFWTSDSGQTWDGIGPSIPVDATVQDVEFIDFNTGWILWTTINADGSSNFTQAVGLELDRTQAGLGMRSQRYAMIVDDGVVTALNVEEPGKFEKSSAETILGLL